MEPDICLRKHGANANSFVANEKIAKRKVSLRQRIYVSLRDDGPQTCEELSLRLDLRYTTVSARLAELKARTWVVPSGTVRQTTGGSRASVIRALTAEEREALLHPTRARYIGRQKELFA